MSRELASWPVTKGQAHAVRHYPQGCEKPQTVTCVPREHRGRGGKEKERKEKGDERNLKQKREKESGETNTKTPKIQKFGKRPNGPGMKKPNSVGCNDPKTRIEGCR
jgi:hypothetical protein